ncbi:electron transport complex subunit E [Pseudothauera nasutitermitis]|uniref:Ion-translocating oxidoreductase complex subunit E n=1 Tax=Pseudothauera nasutitermitis TaxID=2565930 RepID=A0A4S4ARK9_9RHOO|nr:electron transport complex subunit E [Pseudothauera nasutitermitis]THF62415.1 electron transport complex subunit E [Pseudothauera nasutitermitis]
MTENALKDDAVPLASTSQDTGAIPPKENNRYTRLLREGIWGQNVVLVQMLALCPTLAVTGSATNGLAMGLATTAVLIVSNSLVALLRRWISDSVRIPVFVILIASLVTLVDMLLNAYLHELHKSLGLFIALIVVNCAVLGRAESFASKNPLTSSAVDGLAMGLGFTLALVLMGGIREMLGSGTLFAGASLMLGEPFRFLELTLVPDYKGFLLMVLPPGGFLALGFLIAGKQVWDARRKRIERAGQAAAHTRTTG